MSEGNPPAHQGARPGGVIAGAVSAGCFLRSLPLFFSEAPRTPLRVLGIIALDTLHVLRHSRPLPRQRIRELGMFLDLEGCANATWDHKDLAAADYRALRQRLELAGLGRCTAEYVDRLGTLESARPSIGADAAAVRSYREAVARLSITTAAAIALDPDCRDELRAPEFDGDLDTLCRILMQCQVIDDVVDYEEDLSAGLPSFLTATASLPQAMAATADAARAYAAGNEHSANAVFPLRLALFIVSAFARLVIRVAHPRPRHAHQFAQ